MNLDNMQLTNSIHLLVIYHLQKIELMGYFYVKLRGKLDKCNTHAILNIFDTSAETILKYPRAWNICPCSFCSKKLLQCVQGTLWLGLRTPCCPGITSLISFHLFPVFFHILKTHILLELCLDFCKNSVNTDLVLYLPVRNILV